jgi:hypothetical protein
LGEVGKREGSKKEESKKEEKTLEDKEELASQSSTTNPSKP